MKHDFDKEIDRRNTNSVKYDFAAECGMPEDVLPLWVADMDFQAPEAVRQRLAEISRFGVYGYSNSRDDYFAAVQKWYSTNFSWKPKKEWLVKTPGVVLAIAAAIRAFTEPGDGVMIQQPVYYPFRNTILANDRECVNSPLVLEDGRYRMDLDDMEQKIREHDVKLFILCSPHNPVGRVWTKDELAAAGRLCEKYDVIVVSDEIHSDFTYGGLTHTVFPSISPQLAERTILCTAPSKTFNLAGLQVSNIFVPDQKLRRAMRRAIDQTGYGNLNMMGLAACQAAYEEGEDWLQDLKRYLTDNLTYLRQRIKEDLPRIRLIEPEGTYLVWLDLRELDLSEEEQRKLIVDDARLWLDTGTMFGAEGAGFERINIACPRSTLKEAMDRLARALQKKGEA